MVTSQDLWDDVEAAHEARVAKFEGVLERRYDGLVLAELAKRLRDAQIREQEKALRALQMATRRMQRARRYGRRATRLLEATHGVVARAYDEPLPVLPGEEPILEDARRRVLSRMAAELDHAD